MSANYGEFKERTKVLGNIDVQRLSLALDAVRNPAGQIVCGAQLDPTRFAFGSDIGGNDANLAADIANCRPFNPFGVGSALAGVDQLHPAQHRILRQDHAVRRPRDPGG